jgi:hypothetical protein
MFAVRLQHDEVAEEVCTYGCNGLACDEWEMGMTGDRLQSNATWRDRMFATVRTLIVGCGNTCVVPIQARQLLVRHAIVTDCTRFGQITVE